jgi:hypothetical protein
MEFLDLIETIRAEEADAKRLYAGDGRSVRSMSSDSPEYLARLAEAATLIADVYDGRKPGRLLAEAMTTSDFPYLFGDVLDRQLLANYREVPATYQTWARQSTVRDFRTAKRFYTNGGEDILTAVKEREEYPEVSRDEGKYELSVSKYGKSFSISWETFINDDLDALKDQPARFAKAARYSEERYATGLIANNASFFTTGQGNRRTSAGGQLSVASLTAGFQAMADMTDPAGLPILNTPSILLVPPALEVTAMTILNSTEYTYNGDGTTVEWMKVANWLRSKVQLVVNYWLPILDGSKGDTAWYLFASPNEGRGAVEFAKLRGHEAPEIFMKAPDAQRIGGGLNAMDGDFSTDDIRYKIRHVFGGAVLDYRYAYMSEGNSA